VQPARPQGQIIGVPDPINLFCCKNNKNVVKTANLGYNVQEITEDRPNGSGDLSLNRERIMLNFKATAASLAGAGLLLAAAGDATAKEVKLRAAFGTATGTTGQVATFISNAVNKLDPNIKIELSANQPGTRALLQAAKGEAHLHIVVPLISSWLAGGKRMYKKVKNHKELHAQLRTMMMWPGGAFQLFAWEKSGIKTFEDLRGKNVYFGPRGAAVSRIMQGLVKSATGMVAKKDYKLVSLDFGSAGQAFQDGQIDTLFRPVPIGHAPLKQLATINPIRVVGPTKEQLAKPAVKRLFNSPGRQPTQIMPGTYGKNQTNTEPVDTWTDWRGMGIPVSVSEEVAYKMTKAFWEALPDLQKVAAWSKAIKLETVANHANLPFHPGSARYYKERGIDVSKTN